MLLDCLVNGTTLPLQLPKHMGHTHIGEGQIVPARGFGVVAVVGAQIGVQIVST